MELTEDVDYAHCSTPHVAVLALQALKAPLTCTPALAIVKLWYKQMSTALTVRLYNVAA